MSSKTQGLTFCKDIDTNKFFDDDHKMFAVPIPIIPRLNSYGAVCVLKSHIHVTLLLRSI